MTLTAALFALAAATIIAAAGAVIGTRLVAAMDLARN